jgi:hypothetical protein
LNSQRIGAHRHHHLPFQRCHLDAPSIIPNHPRSASPSRSHQSFPPHPAKHPCLTTLIFPKHRLGPAPRKPQTIRFKLRSPHSLNQFQPAFALLRSPTVQRSYHLILYAHQKPVDLLHLLSAPTHPSACEPPLRHLRSPQLMERVRHGHDLRMGTRKSSYTTCQEVLAKHPSSCLYD